MKNRIQNRTFSVRMLIRIGVGVLFFMSGAEKLFHPQTFFQTVRSYQILPEGSITLFAVTVMVIECSAGLALMFNRFLRTGSIVIMMLLSVFILAMIIVLSRGTSIDCGCFAGVFSETVSPLLLGRNIVLIAVLLWLSKKERVVVGFEDHAGRLPD